MDPEGDRPGVPRGTALRLASLTLLTSATTVQIFGQYASAWTTATPLDDARCQVRSGFYPAAANESKRDGYRTCMDAFLGDRWPWLAGGLTLLVTVALLFYALHPMWTRYRRNLAPVPGELVEPLAELVAGVRKPPVFLLDRAKVSAGTVAFGTHRRRYLALDVGVMALRRMEPESFRAVVLDGLRTGVAITAATRALWRAFVVVVLTPYVLTLYATVGWQLLALAGTAALVRYARSAASWTAGIVVLGVAVGLWWSWPAPGTTDVDSAVGSWLDGGGWDRVTTVVRASEQVFTGVRAADPAAIAAGCEALGPVLREPFPAPPDPKIAAMWADGLRALENGTRSCLTVFRDEGPDDGSMTSEFLKGLDQLEVTQTALAEARQRAVS
ncbi:hypothetical protein PV646_09460 [Streptomyces sp. ID05-26A]|nr:hypothetical protein [Streptomyces sp. ID05-26A]